MGEAVRETSIRAGWYGAPTSLTHDLGQIRKGLGPTEMVLVEDPVVFAGPEGPERRTDLTEILKAVDSLVAGLA